MPYTVLPGESLVDPFRLQAGQQVTIPVAQRGDIVVPRPNYGYDEMMADLARLRQRYPFIQQIAIGRSVMGREIPAVRIGTGPREVHYNGSFHAQEWITTPLLMKFLEQYAEAYRWGERIGNFDVPALYRQTSLWLVPMVNPDGVELVLEGIRPGHPYYDLVMRSLGGQDRRVWAANIRGVDLNNQFPAGWEQEYRQGPKQPAPRHYAGPAPLSEPESRAMAEFTRQHNFRLVIAFHSQGEVIFWGFRGLEPPESERIVNLFAEVSGYAPIRYAASAAGYKDWFIQEYRRPGFTVEVGRGVNPLPFGQFWEIWGENIGILLAGLAV
ncbi:MAG: M14 family metallopeptidase [Bacillota bacterium]